MKTLFLFLISFYLCLPLAAALTSGRDTLYNDTFDFSHPDAAQSNDLQHVVQSTSGTEILVGTNKIVATAETVLVNVTQAPKNGYTFVIDLTPANKNCVFCVKTTENNYAKFRITGYYQTNKIIIEWVYQNDGSRLFPPAGIYRNYTRAGWGWLKKQF